MATNPASSFANIFMPKIYKLILELVKRFKVIEKISIKELLRFLDDLFSVFEGTTKQIVELNEPTTHISEIHITTYHSRKRKPS